MKLKYIDSVSFRQSEWTNYKQLSRKLKWELRAGEVACLVSLTGDQIVFVYAPVMLDHPHIEATQCLRSERLRLTGKQRWNPLMLVNYAKQVGIELDGLKRFEDHYKNLT